MTPNIVYIECMNEIPTAKNTAIKSEVKKI